MTTEKATAYVTHRFWSCFWFLRTFLIWMRAILDARTPYYGLQDVVDKYIGARPTFDPMNNPTDRRMEEQRIPPPEIKIVEQELARVETAMTKDSSRRSFQFLLGLMFGLDYAANCAFLYNQGLTGWMLYLTAAGITTVLFALAVSTRRATIRGRRTWASWAVIALFAAIAVGIGYLQYQETSISDEQDTLGAIASAFLFAMVVVGPCVVAEIISKKLAPMVERAKEHEMFTRRLHQLNEKVREANEYLDRITRGQKLWDDELRSIRSTYRGTWSRTFMRAFGDLAALQQFLTTEEPLLARTQPETTHPQLSVINPYERRQ